MDTEKEIIARRERLAFISIAMSEELRIEMIDMIESMCQHHVVDILDDSTSTTPSEI
jgi:hypothetical protein